MTERPALQRKLASRVLLFLTLALVPLGLVGVFQNQRLNAEYEERTALSLLALTEAAASGERALIQRAFGAADTLGELIGWVRDDPERCRATLEGLTTSKTSFAFVGFIPTDGLARCSTASGVLDFSDSPHFNDLMTNPRPTIQLDASPPGSDQSVIIIKLPQFSDSVLQGYTFVSLPVEDVGNAKDFLGEADPLALVTLNNRGEVLSTEDERAAALAVLPEDDRLARLATGLPRIFAGTSRSGQDLVYSVIPIVPDVAYALAAWDVKHPKDGAALSHIVNAALPFLMWLASLFVVWLVIDRLLIDRIQKLNLAMQRFARDRTIPASPRLGKRPTELADLELALHGMAQDILHDEAQQEAKLREKTVLLKEVHHRVKNNLQIISSIMNIQIRKARSEETKRALRQVQDRIMGLSGVHRTLYQANNLSQVDASMLIRQILEQISAIGSSDTASAEVRLALDHVTVFPDQAVPLTMLVSEAVTNAMKYIGGPEPMLSLSLTLEEANKARLVIENTVGKTARTASVDDESTGLGKQLIRAFASQLDGELITEDKGGRHRVEVVFEVTPFREEPQDY
jgi:two-component sensor histidine kinase